jgi:hypothetical protein
VADEAYDSGVSATSPASGGSNAAGLIWLLLAVAAIVLFAVIAARAGRNRSAPAAVPGGPRPAGWYRDPWYPSGMRWWNGAMWTDQVMRR